LFAQTLAVAAAERPRVPNGYTRVRYVHRCRSTGGERLGLEARGAAEAPVVRDEWNLQADRGGGDPAIGRVLLPAERVARSNAVSSKPRVDRHELVQIVRRSCR
jgi:hypothetical protein